MTYDQQPQNPSPQRIQYQADGQGQPQYGQPQYGQPTAQPQAVHYQSPAGAAVKAVPVDDKVSRAAADVNGRNGYGSVVRAVGARQRSDEEIRIALVVLDDLVIEVDNLPADRLIPLNYDIREGRPVLMTTLTTVLGMLPMALGRGEGAEMWRSLGMTVCWGLSISTLVTLVLIPAVYCVFATRQERKIKK